MSIRGDYVLAQFSGGQPKSQVKNHNLTKEIKESKGMEDGIVNVTVNLFPKNDRDISEMIRVFQAAKFAHIRMTKRIRGGMGLLKKDQIETYRTTMDHYVQLYGTFKQNLLHRYHTVVQERISASNGTINANNFPSIEELRVRLGIYYSIIPIPSYIDGVLGLTMEQEAIVKESTENYYKTLTASLVLETLKEAEITITKTLDSIRKGKAVKTPSVENVVNFSETLLDIIGIKQLETTDGVTIDLEEIIQNIRSKLSLFTRVNGEDLSPAELAESIREDLDMRDKKEAELFEIKNIISGLTEAIRDIV